MCRVVPFFHFATGSLLIYHILKEHFLVDGVVVDVVDSIGIFSIDTGVGEVDIGFPVVAKWDEIVIGDVFECSDVGVVVVVRLPSAWCKPLIGIGVGEENSLFTSVICKRVILDSVIKFANSVFRALVYLEYREGSKG